MGFALPKFHKAIKYEFHRPDGLPSSVDVRSSDWSNGFRFIDLFAGIGGIRLGFESVGGKCVFSSESFGQIK